MQFHTKRHWMESIKHLDTYLVNFINHIQSYDICSWLRASKSWMCCNLENI